MSTCLKCGAPTKGIAVACSACLKGEFVSRFCHFERVLWGRIQRVWQTHWSADELVILRQWTASLVQEFDLYPEPPQGPPLTPSPADIKRMRASYLKWNRSTRTHDAFFDQQPVEHLFPVLALVVVGLRRRARRYLLQRYSYDPRYQRHLRRPSRPDATMSNFRYLVYGYEHMHYVVCMCLWKVMCAINEQRDDAWLMIHATAGMRKAWGDSILLTARDMDDPDPIVQTQAITKMAGWGAMVARPDEHPPKHQG